MEFLVILLLLQYPIKVEVLILWVGLAKITSSIFPPVTFPPPKYFLFHLQNYSNCSQQSSYKFMPLFMRGKSHKENEDVSLRPIDHAARKISKKKKLVRKRKFNQYMSIHFYV